VSISLWCADDVELDVDVPADDAAEADAVSVAVDARAGAEPAEVVRLDAAAVSRAPGVRLPLEFR
jgi:hypothetical protein